MDVKIIERLESIEKLLIEQQTLQKQVLNFNETCKYLELSQSHLYKLTIEMDARVRPRHPPKVSPGLNQSARTPPGKACLGNN